MYCNHHVFPVQQAQEMVQEILRERDHVGFSERNDFGSRMGGGMDVSLCVGPRLEVGSVVCDQNPSL